MKTQSTRARAQDKPVITLHTKEAWFPVPGKPPVHHWQATASAPDGREVRSVWFVGGSGEAVRWVLSDLAALGGSGPYELQISPEGWERILGNPV